MTQSRKKLQRIFDSKDYAASQTSGPAGILSGLFRTIMQRLSVGPEKWGYLMKRYIQDPRNGATGVDSDPGSTRSNLATALLGKWMTWRVFIRGLRFLRIIRMRIVLELYTEEGERHIVSQDVDLSGGGGAGGDGGFTLTDLNNCLDFIVAEELGDEVQNDQDPNRQPGSTTTVTNQESDHDE